ncbi:poly(rC)-binding protein 3-like isoform X1 [Metopolophium dirhodum]|uniref:poly(rC)-binding protein 3-like isoform X1 n=1 Tax=Metopolophium dirhodum TaxID=44670 RepID=UPI00298F813E|nr:poly(rC)-binding protein 3-like isoform X1 [Metopolophium dirhodum]XP_060858156.1 poly(rC)-binding protein 3-like isoform X1 [Metopolophium dirhodum]XP_060858157.1 poly(rC)-binding protein 3-like isoform X1 [Metopolophium dirhodum]XP_060858158.1 poly(rC)-binding protein 3-like isoform X1 [Metopolophium dirhodum]XP_060858159.1 poly(rC)-binding protein 3-like isoform X1 [Metopolophium dirhodum]
MSAVVKTENEQRSSIGTSLFNKYDGIDLTIRILLNSREVGNVIGKRGETVKNIRNQSGARVLISNGSTPERIVLISGNRIAICKATELIGLKVEEFFERLNGNWIGPKTPLTLKLIVPASQCGFIIGKNGSKIREIRDSSRAAILVESNMLPHSTERLVSITGTTCTISHCVYLVCNVLLDIRNLLCAISCAQDVVSLHCKYTDGRLTGIATLPTTSGHCASPPPRCESIPFHPCNEISVFETCTFIKDFGAERNIPLTNLAALGSGTATNRGINPAALTALAGSQLRASNRLNHIVSGEQYDKNSNSDIDTTTINVPNGLIGCIIGKRGSKIAKIRQISGAIVHILQSQGTIENGEKVDRRITITGNKESVSVAKYLIEMSVVLQKANLGEVKLSTIPDNGSISTSSTPTMTQQLAKLDPITVISCLYAYIALFGAKKSPPIQTTGVHRPKNDLKRKRSTSNEKIKAERTKSARY